MGGVLFCAGSDERKHGRFTVVRAAMRIDVERKLYEYSINNSRK